MWPGIVGRVRAREGGGSKARDGSQAAHTAPITNEVKGPPVVGGRGGVKREPREQEVERGSDTSGADTGDVKAQVPV
jgi:hypothetical protein